MTTTMAGVTVIAIVAIATTIGMTATTMMMTIVAIVVTATTAEASFSTLASRPLRGTLT